MTRKFGKVFLVGAGPGDPGLITVRGRRLLRSADAVVVDALVDPALLRGIKGRVIDAGKRGPGAPHGSSSNLSQAAINRLLVRLGRQEKRVVRLKGGDPFVFGRGWEEVEALQKADVDVEIVPGVTSAIAAPAAAGIPITDRRWASQVTIVTGHGHAGTRGADPLSPKVNWKRIPSDGTLVVLMGVASWKNIRRKLLEAGWSIAKPVTAIESGTNEDQRVIRTFLGRSAEDFQRRRLVAPAVIVVGEVARLGNRRRRIVVTRPADQSAELISLLEDKGVEVLRAPSIRVRRLRRKIKSQRKSYDWIIFLSSNAVRTFGRKLVSNVLTVGPETKRVAESRGWRVHRVPKQFNTKGVLAALGNVRGKSILIPRVRGAPKELPSALRARGARVEEVTTYETRPARLSVAVKREILRGVDAVTFTSASTARGFLGNFTAAQRKTIFKTAVAVSMGPQTTKALRALGVRRIREAKQSTIPGLIEAIPS